MIPVTYKITLEQPVLTTSLSGDPNSAVAFDYIPGSTIRGMLIEQEQEPLAPSKNADHRRLYFEGSRYLNAYPLVGNTRLLPTPASWRKLKYAPDNGKEDDAEPKVKSTRIFDVAVDSPKDGQRRDRVKVPFQGTDSHTHYLYLPERYLNIHIDRGSRQRGRANEDEGAVYRYDALAAGQVFAGVILCETHDDVAYIQEQMPEIAFLGGARTGGYGRVRIECPADVTWKPLVAQEEPKLQITALSDLLLRDALGATSAGSDALLAWVSEQLGREVSLKASFDNVTEIGGFNRKWNLPLPQAQAIAMGSVFVFEGNFTEAEIDKLRTVSEGGIGGRTVDGFGQIAVNMQVQAEHVAQEVKSAAFATPEGSGKLTDEDIENARTMLERIARQQLEAVVVQRANNLVKSIEDEKRIPNPSQLAQLRAVVQSHSATVKQVQAFRESVNQRQTARTQFERFRIENKPFWEWWGDTVKNDLPRLDVPYTVGGVQVNPANYRDEYVLRLLDEVLARAIRKKKEAS